VKNVDRFAMVAQVKHQLEEFEERPLFLHTVNSTVIDDGTVKPPCDVR